MIKNALIKKKKIIRLVIFMLNLCHVYKFSLVLPCYNEEDNVLPLYKEINELPLEDEKCEIVFVNNGSYDDTEKKN